MNHRPAPPPPRPARHGIPPTRPALTGPAVFLAPAAGLAAAAPGGLLPEPSGTPVPPPPPATAAPAHLPLWAVVALVAGTVALAVATTLITLAIEHIRQARRTPAAEPEPSTSAAEPDNTHTEVPHSPPHAATRDKHKPDTR